MSKLFWPRLFLIVLLITVFTLSACNGDTASDDASTLAVVTSGENEVSIVSVGEPVRVVADFGEETAVTRAELWQREATEGSARLIAEAQPDEAGRVWFEWQADQAGRFVLELRAYTGQGELQALVLQEVYALEEAAVIASEIETTGIIDIDIPERIIDALLPRIFERIQIGDEPIIISTRLILFFLYLMLFIFVAKMVSNTLLNWSQERRAAQLADIDLMLRQLDLERARLDFLRQQQEFERGEAGNPYPLSETESGPLSLIERRRLRYLREQSPSVSGEKNPLLEIVGGMFFGGLVGFVSSLIIGLIIALFQGLFGSDFGDPAEDFFFSLAVTGLYLGLLLGLAAGLINLFSNRSFFSSALGKIFSSFTGQVTRLVSPSSSKPAGSFGRTIGGSLVGLFYGAFYGLLLGVLAAGLIIFTGSLGAESFSSAPERFIGVLSFAIIGTVAGGVVGWVGGVLYGLLGERN